MENLEIIYEAIVPFENGTVKTSVNSKFKEKIYEINVKFSNNQIFTLKGTREDCLEKLKSTSSAYKAINKSMWKCQEMVDMERAPLPKKFRETMDKGSVNSSFKWNNAVCYISGNFTKDRIENLEIKINDLVVCGFKHINDEEDFYCKPFTKYGLVLTKKIKDYYKKRTQKKLMKN